MEPDKKVLIDNIIGALKKAHKIPGVSIAVVKDGQTVLTSGYGHTELQQPSNTKTTSPCSAPTVTEVNEHTKFNIGSITKGFTAVVLANILQLNKE